MKTWLRNAVFVLTLLLVLGGAAGRFVRRERFAEPKPVDVRSHGAASVAASARRVDAAFAEEWTRKRVAPLPLAPDLTWARRLSLALTGTVPSVEEIRAFEKVSPALRAEWWVSHLLQDRRFSDYFAERLARIAVGVEGGPFIVYRRHRLVTWLGEQIHRNRPYDALVRDAVGA